MGFASPLGNLKSFASSRPPLVVFTLCLTAFALTTYSLAYFIKRAENVPNPDVALDWNTFISHMAELDLCVLLAEDTKSGVLSSQSRHSITQTVTVTPQSEENVNSSSSRTVTNSVTKLINPERDPKNDNGEHPSIVTMSVTASLSLIQELSTLPHNVSTITGTLQAHQLELNSHDVSPNATLNVTFHLPTGIQNASQSQEICLTFEGSSHLLPSTKSPPSCSLNPVPSSEMENNHIMKFIGHHRGPADQVELGDSHNGLELWCSEGSLMHMAYHPDPDLTVLLTMRDRSLINLHLLHTSYFLFVLAMTVVCYALIKGKPKPKQFDKVLPLDP